MVFLYNHNSFNVPLVDYEQQQTDYKIYRKKKNHLSLHKQLKELTPENKSVLISLGFNLKKL